MMKMKLAGAAALMAMASGAALANHQWGNYHWASDGNGVTLNISRNIGSQWISSYDGAVDDWNRSQKLTLVDKGNVGGSAKKCDPISGEILVCADTYGYRGWLGVASIWANGVHITQGTTKLNDSYYSPGSSYDVPAWRNLVTCQEIGHDFGLDHQDENFNNKNLGTCMDYTNDPSSNQHPNQHDYDQLAAMYSHDDGGSGGDPKPCRGGPRQCGSGSDAFTFREVGQAHPLANAQPGDWGRAVGYDGAGRPDTFLLDLGNGNRRITHVFWVPGFRPTREHMHD